MSVRWNTLVKFLGLLKLFKFYLQLNLIKNKEWKQLSVLNTEHKVYNLINIEARWDGNDKTITARLGKRKMKLSFYYNFNLDITQKDGGLECEFWECQTNNVATVYSSSKKIVIRTRNEFARLIISYRRIYIIYHFIPSHIKTTFF